MKSVIAFSFLLLVNACSSKSCDELVLDSFKHHDTATISEKIYYLYSRTTGWQEKVVFFELYEEKPTFDKCMHSNVQPIFARAFDDAESRPYVAKMILQPEQPEKLKIIYTTDINDAVVNIYDVKFAR